MSLISDKEAERISAAITDAERKTSGEIVAVVAEQSSRYQHVPFMWAALLALVIPWPLIHFTWMKVQWIFLIQLLVFLGLLALAWHPKVRMALVPKSIANANARRRASLKRGGSLVRRPLPESALYAPSDDDGLLALDERTEGVPVAGDRKSVV